MKCNMGCVYSRDRPRIWTKSDPGACLTDGVSQITISVVKTSTDDNLDLELVGNTNEIADTTPGSSDFNAYIGI